MPAADPYLYSMKEHEERNSGLMNIKDLVNETLKRSEARAKGTMESAYTPTGLFLLDQLIGGWERGDLVVLGARPGMGKTSLALFFARNMAIEHQIPTAYFTFESNEIQLTEKLLSCEAEVDLRSLKQGKLELQDWNKLEKGLDRISKGPLLVSSKSFSSIENMVEEIGNCAREKGVRFVAIDYLQLIHHGFDRHKREIHVSEIVRNLKRTANEHQITILLLSQLSRALEYRSGWKLPQLSDLRDSGSIEEEASKILFLYRPEVYGIDCDEEGNSLKGMGEIIVAKNRSGACGNVHIRFLQKFGKFLNLEIKQEALGEIRPGDIFDDEDIPF